MSIDWFAFVIVAVATLVASMVVVGSYGLGVRLLAVATDAVPARQAAVRLGAYACFAVCVAAVLYGIYLIVPAFH
ncbi:hypothetical protein [Arthrobacter crystallopoietes]|jgi:hypothetical protein|uniref:Uncharacterized protein n=1 Tax=Crystallibacter crystallopoietes TaxID=37928 RepID=A0A1H1GRK0_9MICC|nr:hypothetical protein [Arthrobacter crystallopoietes]AUI52408.1 hypothetical protein AC20117_18060 [Arthrobacter crystallopoietes]SDR15805.1 hypothetical protein SAMN04489742_4263 [Arthrobacter crystallopoietes]